MIQNLKNMSIDAIVYEYTFHDLPLDVTLSELLSRGLNVSEETLNYMSFQMKNTLANIIYKYKVVIQTNRKQNENLYHAVQSIFDEDPEIFQVFASSDTIAIQTTIAHYFKMIQLTNPDLLNMNNSYKFKWDVSPIDEFRVSDILSLMDMRKQ